MLRQGTGDGPQEHDSTGWGDQGRWAWALPYILVSLTYDLWSQAQWVLEKLRPRIDNNVKITIITTHHDICSLLTPGWA